MFDFDPKTISETDLISLKNYALNNGLTRAKFYTFTD